MKFSEQLKGLGFATYADYLRSDGWREFRCRYRDSGASMVCAVCQSRGIQLHHRTYVRLGCEKFEDVIPLCRQHHEAVHIWLKTSGRRFVEYTHEAIESLRWSPAKVIVLPDLATPKSIMRERAREVHEKNRKRAAEKRERRRERALLNRHEQMTRGLEHAQKEKLDRERSHAERVAKFEPYRIELRRLCDAGAIKPHTCTGVCASLNVIQAKATIAAGRLKLNPAPPKPGDPDFLEYRHIFLRLAEMNLTPRQQDAAVGHVYARRLKALRGLLRSIENRPPKQKKKRVKPLKPKQYDLQPPRPKRWRSAVFFGRRDID